MIGDDWLVPKPVDHESLLALHRVAQLYGVDPALHAKAPGRFYAGLAKAFQQESEAEYWAANASPSRRGAPEKTKTKRGRDILALIEKAGAQQNHKWPDVAELLDLYLAKQANRCRTSRSRHEHVDSMNKLLGKSRRKAKRVFDQWSSIHLAFAKRP
jgi:hypothetical protein